MAETTPLGVARTSPLPSENGDRQGERTGAKNIPQIPNLSPKESLLIWQHKQTLEDALKNHSTVILAAGTGTGKTRGGSQIALETLGPGENMIVTENLRRATEESAKVIAADMQVEVGDTVGVRNRYSHEFSDRTRLLFCPVQSLLVMMEDDPLLERYSLVAMDEVHKESKANELAMIRLRDIQAERRSKGKPPLKLMFISATADKDKIMRHFPDAVSVDVPGKTFPVDEHYETSEVPVAAIPKRAAEKVKESILAGDQGNILVFLSGKTQIDEAASALQGLTGVKVIPYYSAASKEEQDSLFSNSRERKVILATNAAQEGLTLDINVVVDTCMHKHMELDTVSGRQVLAEQKAPKDHLIQRRGRVGRKESPFPGQNDKYYALATKQDWDGRPEHEAAEMQRTDLTQELLLIMAQGGADVQKFNYINKPPDSHIQIALKRLGYMGAVRNGALTEKGRLMAELQVKPELASMIVSSVEYRAVRQACALAAMLEVYPDALETANGAPSPFAYPHSDVVGMIDIIRDFHGLSDVGQRKKWARDNRLNYWKLNDASRLYHELVRTLKTKKPGLDVNAETPPGALDRSIYEGLAGSVVRSSARHKYSIDMVGPVQMERKSALYENAPDQFVTFDLRPNMENDAISTRRASLNHAIPLEITRQASESKHTTPLPSQSQTETATAPSQQTSEPPSKETVPEIPPEPPPPPPTTGQKIKEWFARSFVGRLWRWITG